MHFETCFESVYGHDQVQFPTHSIGMVWLKNKFCVHVSTKCLLTCVCDWCTEGVIATMVTCRFLFVYLCPSLMDTHLHSCNCPAALKYHNNSTCLLASLHRLMLPYIVGIKSTMSFSQFTLITVINCVQLLTSTAE